MDKNPHIFLTGSNQHIWDINRHFYGTLNHFGPIFFAEYLKQNESYKFKDMLFQSYRSDFIVVVIKDVESRESRSHWTLMTNSEVNNKHKNKDGKLKTILSIWYFKRNRFPDLGLIKQNYRLYLHGVMQKLGVNYWCDYAAVVNFISVRSLWDIASINEFPSRSIDFVLSFPQAHLDVDFIMELPLCMGVGGKRGQWVLKLNKPLYGLKK